MVSRSVSWGALPIVMSRDPPFDIVGSQGDLHQQIATQILEEEVQRTTSGGPRDMVPATGTYQRRHRSPLWLSLSAVGVLLGVCCGGSEAWIQLPLAKQYLTVSRWQRQDLSRRASHQMGNSASFGGSYPRQDWMTRQPQYAPPHQQLSWEDAQLSLQRGGGPGILDRVRLPRRSSSTAQPSFPQSPASRPPTTYRPSPVPPSKTVPLAPRSSPSHRSPPVQPHPRPPPPPTRDNRRREGPRTAGTEPWREQRSFSQQVRKSEVGQKDASVWAQPVRREQPKDPSRQAQRGAERGSEAEQQGGAEVVEVRGIVKRITFASDDGGFTVLKLESEGADKSVVTVVGTFPSVHAGAALAVKGHWVKNSKYGRQLKAQEYVETAPATQAGIENYLASGLVKGIGPVAAKQIVAHFGVDTLRILNEEPQRLTEVEGIGRKKAEMISQAWQGQKEVTSVMLFLQAHNVTTMLATRIYKAYGNASIAVTKNDPYQLADDLVGIGFRTVDKIAHQLGFDRQSPKRFRSGLLYFLKEQSNDGHCFGLRSQVLRDGARMLGAPVEALNVTLEQMILRGEVVQRRAPRGAQALYLPFFDTCETETATRIGTMVGLPSVTQMSAQAKAQALAKVQRDINVTFDDVQLTAVSAALQSRFTIVTGGPGTGKTTTALGIIGVLREQGRQVALAAPTGRAAQRLADATGLDAKTLHRLLEYSPETRSFKRGPGNKLACDVLVVDEASMVDIVLMHNLLAALPLTSSLVLVGDVDQLPSVGPGNVLRDVIDSGRVEVVRLTRIFRQAQKSAIITNAHLINEGKMPELGAKKARMTGRRGAATTTRQGAADGDEAAAAPGGKAASQDNRDFFLIEEEDPVRIVELVTELCTRRLPKHYGLDPIADIQVLCPMRKGEVGTLQLNSVLQKALNPQNPSIKYGGTEFRKGDKVMQVKNNYEKNVFNGGTGTIVEVDTSSKSLTVAFDGMSPVTYDATELDQIVLSYAATVHKAQGSEYRVVVAPLLHRQHAVMLQRNLLYTCVTRAKELLVLVGTREAISRAVENNRPHKRNSMLRLKLLGVDGQGELDEGDDGLQ